MLAYAIKVAPPVACGPAARLSMSAAASWSRGPLFSWVAASKLNAAHTDAAHAADAVDEPCHSPSRSIDVTAAAATRALLKAISVVSCLHPNPRLRARTCVASCDVDGTWLANVFGCQALSNAIALVDAIALGEIWRRPARNINPISASHVALLGAVVNVLLSLLKLVVGSLCGSAGEM